MQGFGGAGFPQVFAVLRVFYTSVVRSGHYRYIASLRHYRTCSGNDV